MQPFLEGEGGRSGEEGFMSFCLQARCFHQDSGLSFLPPRGFKKLCSPVLHLLTSSHCVLFAWCWVNSPSVSIRIFKLNLSSPGLLHSHCRHHLYHVLAVKGSYVWGREVPLLVVNHLSWTFAYMSFSVFSNPFLVYSLRKLFWLPGWTNTYVWCIQAFLFWLTHCT